MANGRGDDFRRSVRMMRTVISIHYPRRIAQVFFLKKNQKILGRLASHFPAVFCLRQNKPGQASRSEPRKIPYKSPALPDCDTAARAAAARPRPPGGREGVIAPGFPGTGGVSKGDSVPLRRRDEKSTP